MTESILQRQITIQPDSAKIQKWMRWLVWKIAIATVLLMAVGSATRVMNAGLACPDWPLCYGQLIPSQQMNLQVFLEWFHRLDAALIGMSTMALVGLSWWYRTSLPKWLPPACTLALGLIVFQGVLGGLTVTQLLRFDIVTAHLGAAMLFLCSLVVIATMLTPYQGNGTAGKLSWVGLIAALLIYVQSLMGGLVASRWAVHQCLGGSELCVVMNSHLLGVIPATGGTLILAILAWRTAALHPVLKNLAYTAAGIVAFQVFLGVATLRLHLQVEPLTVAHHTVGATLLAVLVAFTVFSLRDRVLLATKS
ncbi:COX15/CtaA family protein [Gloeothece verrucosa]|uniref:Cytochrome oxidase assembly n=1 Tax=Gloeothece verrucosa (strain PCC 7822) TaxID=497965 RepID=E0UJF0_GLOV7|nr:heme A synthase [Gloeothece verrucosa]ADN16968.1 cytochrome oxidase assembly [Gloeothece verrucosa PCC 7822]